MKNYGEFWDKFSKDYKQDVAYLGDEWGPAKEIVDQYIKPYLQDGMKVLEIGPGGGRLTDPLAAIAGVDNVEVADCSQEMLNRIKVRFGGRVKGYLTDGKSVDAVQPDHKYGFVFSYDAFVHIDLFDTINIILQIDKLTEPKTVFVVHHCEMESAFGFEHWYYLRRAYMRAKQDNCAGVFAINSARLMRTALRYYGFRVLKQEAVRHGRDTVTVFSR